MEVWSGVRGGRRQEIKDLGSKEEEKAPAAPANRFSAMPASPSVLQAPKQNAASVGCQA